MQCCSPSTQASGAGITSACAVLRRSAAAAHWHVAVAENKVVVIQPAGCGQHGCVCRSWEGSRLSVGIGNLRLEHFYRIGSRSR
jgi:hypothetical protein